MSTQLFKDQSFVRAPALRDRWEISDMTLWRWLKAGKIPNPKYINGKRVWLQSDIEQAEQAMFADESASPWRMKRG